MVGERDPRKRFAKEVLFREPDAPLRHFIPIDTASIGKLTPRQDRFGNHVLTSPDRAYLDKQGQPTKAAILISPAGREFRRRNKVVLEAIDRVLVEATDSPAPREDSSSMIRVEEKWPGGQSDVYKVDINGEKLILKVKTTDSDAELIDQPYINEMLQTQAIATDLEPELSALDMGLSTFLFASSQMSCTLFEEGVHPSSEDATKIRDEFEPLLSWYMFDRLFDRNELWKRVFLDISKFGEVKVNNFIKRPDGKIICIDPFYYYPQS